MIRNILVLPNAGTNNPYQKMWVESISTKYNIVAGSNDVLFPGIFNWYRYKGNFDTIHYDWINLFTKKNNHILSLIACLSFILDTIIIKYIFKKHIFWTVHNIWPHDTKHSTTLYYTRKIFIHLAHRIRFFSIDSMHQLKKFYKIEKELDYKIIPMGNHIDFYKPYVNNSHLIKTPIPEDFINSTTLKILFIGAIKKYKGISVFLKNLKSHKNCSDINILICGKVEENYESELLNELVTHNNISLINSYIEHDTIPKLFEWANLVVNPYIDINHSGSINLAMSFGLAVIAPNLDSIKQQLSNSQDTLLYNDHNQIEEILTYCKKNKELISSVGKKNKEKIKKIDWSNQIDLFDI